MDDVSEEEEVDEMKRTSDTYQELMWLKRVRREKEFQLIEGVQIHDGFSCNGCEVKVNLFYKFVFRITILTSIFTRSSQFVLEDSLAQTVTKLE